VVNGCITEVRDFICFAALRIRCGGQVVAVDVRPTDAFGLGLKCGAPILVAERVLAEVCGP
jgi:bifunctional DNase/RNase